MRKKAESYPIENLENSKQPLLASKGVVSLQVGAPSKYQESYCTLAYNLCSRFGFTNKQLADSLGINESTLYQWIAKYSPFKEAVQNGKDIFDSIQVESALLKRAIGYELESEVRTEGTKADALGNPVPYSKVVRTVKHIPPSIDAAKFWLENRRSDRFGKRLEKTDSPKQITINYAQFDRSELQNLRMLSLKASNTIPVSNLNTKEQENNIPTLNKSSYRQEHIGRHINSIEFSISNRSIGE